MLCYSNADAQMDQTKHLIIASTVAIRFDRISHFQNLKVGEIDGAGSCDLATISQTQQLNGGIWESQEKPQDHASP